jgi:3-phenylpropionate/trans-cinnamate dioxygenase ferredoxin subunit
VVVAVAEVRAGRVQDLPANGARRVESDGHRVAVVRIGDDWYAIGDRCSHAEASLAEGEVDAAACTIECPKHGAAFSLATGEPRSLPATRSVPVYRVRIDGDDIIVEVP